MPKKAAGDRTVFDVFAEHYPESAAYFIEHHPGASFEIQTITNRHWRSIDTPYRIGLTHHIARSEGKTHEQAIQAACKFHKISRSKVREVVGPELQDDDADDVAYDAEWALESGKVLDQILALTYSHRLDWRQRLDELCEEYDYLEIDRAKERMARVLRVLPDKTPRGRVRLREKLHELGLSDDDSLALARLIGYAVGLQPINSEQRRLLLDGLRRAGPEGAPVADFIQAQCDNSQKVGALAEVLKEIEQDDDRLFDTFMLSSQLDDETRELVHCLWSQDQRPVGTRDVQHDWEHRWRPIKAHVEDKWPMSVLTDVENFALAYPRVRVLHVPEPKGERPLKKRDDEIRSKFANRRQKGDPAGEIIQDLAAEYYLGRKRIEVIVYHSPTPDPGSPESPNK